MKTNPLLKKQTHNSTRDAQSLTEHKNTRTAKASDMCCLPTLSVHRNKPDAKYILFFMVCAATISLLAGCATLNRMSIGAHAPIFLNIDKKELEQTQFYIDGEPVQWRMIEYNRTLVSQGSNYDSYNIMSMPAIDVRPRNQYYTLTIKNPRIVSKDILLKRGKAMETKYWLLADMWLSAGFGVLVDVSTNALLRLPPVDVNTLSPQSSPFQFYDNTEITIEKKYFNKFIRPTNYLKEKRT